MDSYTCENHFGYIPEGNRPECNMGPIAPGSVVTDQKIYGVKRLIDCKESLESARRNGRPQETFSTCWAGVIADGTIVRAKDDRSSVSDLRTNRLIVTRMWSADGTECESGTSPLFRWKYHVGQWRSAYVDRDITWISTNGLHFWPFVLIRRTTARMLAHRRSYYLFFVSKN